MAASSDDIVKVIVVDCEEHLWDNVLKRKCLMYTLALRICALRYVVYNGLECVEIWECVVVTNSYVLRSYTPHYARVGAFAGFYVEFHRNWNKWATKVSLAIHSKWDYYGVIRYEMTSSFQMIWWVIFWCISSPKNIP